MEFDKTIKRVSRNSSILEKVEDVSAEEEGAGGRNGVGETEGVTEVG